jgi:hypothetical protein
MGRCKSISILKETLILLNLLQGEQSKIISPLEGVIPLDNPSEGLLQGKSRTPPQVGTRLGSIQFERVGFSRVAC